MTCRFPRCTVRRQTKETCNSENTMNRFIRFSIFALLAALMVLPPSAAQTQRTAKRPNIVFIMTDDHAAHAISAYGSKLIQTPNIDRLAREGMKFENCFVTNSICTPSRAAILTGKYAHQNGVPVFNHIDNAQPMLPKYLQAAGYHTGNGRQMASGRQRSEAARTKANPAGFDYWNILPGQGAYFDPVMIENGERKKLTGYTTDIITDLSMDFVKNRPQDKPFFLMYHHKAPHRNWQPDEKTSQAVRRITSRPSRPPSTTITKVSPTPRASPRCTLITDLTETRSDKGETARRLNRRGTLKRWKVQTLHAGLSGLRAISG